MVSMGKRRSAEPAVLASRTSSGVSSSKYVDGIFEMRYTDCITDTLKWEMFTLLLITLIISAYYIYKSFVPVAAPTYRSRSLVIQQYPNSMGLS